MQTSIDFTLYLITDTEMCGGFKRLLQAVEIALAEGIKAIQLREKGIPIRDYLAHAEAMRTVTARQGARLFINDRVDIAVAVEADGVHLGQAGIPAYAAKAVAPHLAVGVSAHSIEESQRAENEGADFVTFGPIYATPSKLRYGDPLGLEPLGRVVAAVRLPVFGIGGIKKEHLADLRAAGARGAALISGILAAADVRKAAQEYVKIMGEKI
ncbi:MAG TPA: thiamine phosphate synthase [Dissulfurispiraceae bacterium]|nr:thiamine phosphate synthase [Dissulfurispiraceae bacterium]